MNDPKQGEREYFARIGEEGRRHVLRKPFGDEQCGQYLVNIAAFLSVMRPPPARVVEFGCGSGWLSLILAERGYNVVGVDISPDGIALAEQLKAERGIANISFQVADYENVRIAPSADYAIFHDALHHAESELDALRAAHAALAPGGMLICIEPGDGHSTSASSRRAIEEFGVHEKDMPPRKIIRFAREAGFGRHLVLPWPWFHWASVYRTGYGKASSLGELRGKKFLSLWRLVRAFFRTHDQGFVLLWRD